MGNKLSSSPFPSYEAASTQYSVTEMREMKAKFEALRYHHKFDYFTWLAFILLIFTPVLQQQPRNYICLYICKGLFCVYNWVMRLQWHIQQLYTSQRQASFGSYAHRHVHPRIFSTFDTKRDGSIDFEEYLCGVTVFRTGTIEDKLKCTFTVVFQVQLSSLKATDHSSHVSFLSQAFI